MKQTAGPGPREQEIARIRGRIDALDQTIHASLIARMEQAQALRALKGAHGPVRRPAREAQILRARAAAHHGRLPLAALAALWQEIFAAAAQLQGAEAVILGTRAAAARRQAQEWCGRGGRFEICEAPDQVWRALAGNARALALMPPPGSGAAGRWWTSLPEGLRIIGLTPFLSRAQDGALAIIAAGRPAPSGDDTSLIAVQGAPPEALAEGGKQAGLSCRVQDRSGGWILVALDAFVAEDDPRLFRLQEIVPAPVRCLGAFANPLPPPKAHREAGR